MTVRGLTWKTSRAACCCLLTSRRHSTCWTLKHSWLRLHSDFGIAGVASTWIRSYLTGRQCYVAVGNSRSDRWICHEGEPQGSVSKPLMFSCHVSAIGRMKRLLQRSAINSMLTTPNFILQYGQQKTRRGCSDSYEEVTRWFLINGLLLNAGKTESIAFGTRQQLAKRSTDMSLKIGDASVAIVESIKLLGVIARFDPVDGQTGERSRQSMQFSYPCLATCALLLDARGGTDDFDRTRCLQVRLLQLPAVRHFRVEPRQAAAGSERFGSCGPASTLGMPRHPIVARSSLAPHSSSESDTKSP